MDKEPIHPNKLIIHTNSKLIINSFVNKLNDDELFLKLKIGMPIISFLEGSFSKKITTEIIEKINQDDNVFFIIVIDGYILTVAQCKLPEAIYYLFIFEKIIVDEIPTLIKKNKSEQDLKILLVEDNLIALHLLESIVKQAGFKFFSATDGEKAFESYIVNKPDIVFTDIGLPILNGNQLSKKVRAFEKERSQTSIPIIGLTAHDLKTAEAESLNAGMNKLLNKPIQLVKFREIINQYFPFIKEENTFLYLGADLPKTEEEFFILEAYPTIDKNIAIANLGSEKIFHDLLNLMMIQEIPQDVQQIKKAYLDKNWNKVEELVHRMKSGALYCGTTRLKFACQFLERYYKTGKTELLERLYQQLMTVIAITTEEARALLADK